ncbi:hypothetical protein Y032_0020g49 [Ancylostoma ceylanicum]|uniref:Uncharacterized protein n=1 Tax=Ancylostoma ceylanicum TaxID=53326 RepID=A0A016V175_9BILA|nr:hypothetical protein Y032_0020g49 [Ancylostoma ceylanicum]
MSTRQNHFVLNPTRGRLSITIVLVCGYYRLLFSIVINLVSSYVCRFHRRLGGSNLDMFALKDMLLRPRYSAIQSSVDMWSRTHRRTPP